MSTRIARTQSIGGTQMMCETYDAITHDNDTYAYRRTNANVDSLRRYTIYVKYDGQWIEEIDVDAINARDARAIARIAMQMHYEFDDDARIVKTIERYGLYF